MELHSNVPDRLTPGMRVFALAAEGNRRELKIAEVWPHQDRLIVKFDGMNSISEAEPLVGCELQVPVSERAALEAGSIYISDLVGCTVFDSDRDIGEIRDVRFGAGEAPLLIVSPKENGTKEYEIPFAGAYLIAAAAYGNPREAHEVGGVLAALRGAPYGRALIGLFGLAFIGSSLFDFVAALYRRFDPQNA